MAEARKCDRCGIYYDNNTKHNFGITILGHGIMATGITMNLSNDDKGISYDLCDGCLTNFYEKFLKGGRTNG